MPTRPLRRATLVLALATLCGSAIAQHAVTPDWPSKPLKIIVGFPGGSSPDLVARTLAEPLAKALGQPAVVMGDTRDMDAALLSQHPELQQAYAQWAGQDNLRKALAHAGSRGVVVGGRP